MGKYPHSQAAEADELIAGKISEGTQWKVHSGQP